MLKLSPLHSLLFLSIFYFESNQSFNIGIMFSLLNRYCSFLKIVCPCLLYWFDDGILYFYFSNLKLISCTGIGISRIILFQSSCCYTSSCCNSRVRRHRVWYLLLRNCEPSRLWLALSDPSQSEWADWKIHCWDVCRAVSLWREGTLPSSLNPSTWWGRQCTGKLIY